MNRNEIAAQLEFFKDIGVDSVEVAAVGAVGEAQARQRAASGIDRPGAHRAPLQLDAIRAEIGDCQRCKLAPTRTHIVFGSGNPDAELVFVGEAPGYEENLSIWTECGSSRRSIPHTYCDLRRRSAKCGKT